jgi:hypothetical protein
LLHIAGNQIANSTIQQRIPVDIASILAKQLDERFRTKAIEQVQQAVYNTAENLPPLLILTFTHANGLSLAPNVSVTYAKALWCFARGKQYDGVELESAASQPIINACQQVIADLFKSSELNSFLSDLITRGELIDANIQQKIRTEAGWISGEAQSIAGISGPLTIVTKPVLGYLEGQAQQVMSSAAGKSVLATIAKIIGTTQGKIFLAKLISAAAAKVAASASMKIIILGAVKKIGVVVIVKAVIVKLLAVVAPTLVAAKIPIFWIVLPILILLIRSEINHMPKKLAQELAPQVGQKVGEAFYQICHDFAEKIISETSQEISNYNHGK